MNIYYAIGKLKKESPRQEPLGKLERTLESDYSQTTPVVQITESREYPKNYSQQTSIPRKKVVPAMIYREVKELTQLKKQHQDQKTISAINSQIRFHQEKPLSKEPLTKKQNILDLEGNLIGMFYKSHQPYRPKHLNLGNTNYVLSYSFKVGTTKTGENCLRTTAYLNEKGTEVLQSYIKRQLKIQEKKRKDMKGGRGKIKNRSSNVKSIIRSRNTFDIVIEGINIHLDQKGKIEIIYEYPELKDILQNGQKLSERQDARSRYFTRYSPVKKWIYSTTQEFNNFTGEKLEELSVVVNEILAEETPCTSITS